MVTKAKKRERRAQRHAAAANRIATRRTREKEQAGKTTELLTDDNSLPQDMALVATAVKNRWPVQEDKAAILVDRLMDIAKKTKVAIPCGEGVFESEAVADVNAIKAIDLMKKMTEQNTRENKVAPAVGAPQTTINVGVSVDAATGADERRRRTLAIAERFRSGGVLFVDSTRQD